MTMSRYFLCFLFYSFIGWAYECVFYSVQHKRFVNSGFLNGCICPIYGIGALLILILLRGIESNAKLFLTGMLVTGVLEYFTSWFFEKLFHERWWDYTQWPLNINGRVCLLGALAFGTMALLLVRVIDPFTQNMIDFLSPNTILILTILSGAAVILDIIFTIRHIDMASKKLWFVEKQSQLVEQRRVQLRTRLDNSKIIGNVRAMYIRRDTDEHESIVERIRRFLYK